MHSTQGTGSLPPVWGPDAAPDEDENADWRGRDNSRDWLRLAGALRVAEGLTTLEEVLSATPPLD